MIQEISCLRKGDTIVTGRCQFVRLDQELSLDEWPSLPPGDSASSDAHEFGLLAHERWRNYQRQSLAVDSLDRLKERIRKNPKVEVGMLCRMDAKPYLDLPCLGRAFFRRTWANNLYIDFLTAHPEKPAEVKGVGIGLLDFIISVAEAIEAGSVWGETTSDSVGFYQSVFGRERFNDRFSLPQSRYHWFWKTRLSSMREQFHADPRLQTQQARR